MGAVFEVVRDLNNYLKENETLDKQALIKSKDFFETVENILGVIGINTIGEEFAETLSGSEIEGLIKEREAARKKRDFARADAIRNELASKGIILEDTPLGTRWKKKEQ
ncbi:MAG: hypothetical protein ABC360_01090 [Acetomicrobium sp.]